MEKTIRKIIEIEQKAAQITEQARQACEDMPAHIEAELSAYEAELAQQYGAKCAEQLARLRRQTEEREQADRKAQAEAVSRLQGAYERHGEEWAQRLFESVTRNV